MMGRKTLGEVRAELEAALGVGPIGGGEPAESLRRFLAAGTGQTDAPPGLPSRPIQPAAPASEDAERSPGGPVR
jgi:hypothetical protein